MVHVLITPASTPSAVPSVENLDFCAPQHTTRTQRTDQKRMISGSAHSTWPLHFDTCTAPAYILSAVDASCHPHIANFALSSSTLTMLPYIGKEECLGAFNANTYLLPTMSFYPSQTTTRSERSNLGHACKLPTVSRYETSPSRSRSAVPAPQTFPVPLIQVSTPGPSTTMPKKEKRQTLRTILGTSKAVSPLGKFELV
ncbi:hypothetical protein BOTBODRAFT_462486 [Botryobasidium botryosum FD-172 SS1]|uniref:Uncharacterized protein n=1 Tax=Botryobasidium botryosum (strain FD-172 SS1) TaxID=930990 RepID=A0A067MH34_BOTB1|nr:hypothetical protein BOTBODRAFT_462486 [Botryobasidium botryosum FD-172 SS1]